MTRSLFTTTALALFGAAAAAPPVHAQSILDYSARTAPQFYDFRVRAPANMAVSEFAIPLFVELPVTPALVIDVGSSYASARVEESVAGKRNASRISGLTDTQIRATYTIGTDAIVLTAGANVPTGQSTVTSDQQRAAAVIGSDFLAFPISNMGTGFGATAAAAGARPVRGWNVGGGVSLRHSARYDPVAQRGGGGLRYQPGNEYRVRVGADHPLGTGRVSGGFTYATFGNDDLSGSIYNTGDRYVAQIELSNTLGPGDIALAAWNLHRSAGTLADSSYFDHENILNTSAAYSLLVGLSRLEPSLGFRYWAQPGLPSSRMTTLGLELERAIGGVLVAPRINFALGRLASEDADGATATAGLRGFGTAIVVRVRQ
jgi:hypothetical protein